MVIPVLVAVNGPSVEGVAGSDSDTPALGTGLGIVTLKVSVPDGNVAGVAPLARSWAVAEPVRVGDREAAALANVSGRFTTVWYPVTLKVWPADGAAGDNMADVTASLSTMSPTGVPGQYSS